MYTFAISLLCCSNTTNPDDAWYFFINIEDDRSFVLIEEHPDMNEVAETYSTNKSGIGPEVNVYRNLYMSHI